LLTRGPSGGYWPGSGNYFLPHETPGSTGAARREARCLMIERKTLPVDDETSIAIVTERMGDGTWAVVASVTHRSPTGEQITDLPVRDSRYGSQEEAEQAGVSQGRDWIERNMPHAA
jgi:hypothetical protein